MQLSLDGAIAGSLHQVRQSSDQYYTHARGIATDLAWETRRMAGRLRRKIEHFDVEGELTGLPRPPRYNDIRLIDTKPLIEHRLAVKEFDPLFVPRDVVAATILSHELCSVKGAYARCCHRQNMSHGCHDEDCSDTTL